MDNLKCFVNEEINKSFPDFDITFLFENEFFNDVYTIKPDRKGSNIFKCIKYNVYKNDMFINNILLENYNINSFMDNVIESIDDYDFKRLYDKNIKNTLVENYNNFINIFEQNIIKNKNTLLGEIYQMRKSAGI